MEEYSRFLNPAEKAGLAEAAVTRQSIIAADLDFRMK